MDELSVDTQGDRALLDTWLACLACHWHHHHWGHDDDDDHKLMLITHSLLVVVVVVWVHRALAHATGNGAIGASWLLAHLLISIITIIIAIVAKATD